MGDVIRARTRFWVASLALLALWGAPAEAIEYQETPMFEAKVAAGEIPAVADRLPENPALPRRLDVPRGGVDAVTCHHRRHIELTRHRHGDGRE